MTLPQERARAVVNAMDFLIRLSSPYEGGIKGVKKDVRAEARSLLRHFPTLHDLRTLSEKCPDVLWLQRIETDE